MSILRTLVAVTAVAASMVYYNRDERPAKKEPVDAKLKDEIFQLKLKLAEEEAKHPRNFGAAYALERMIQLYEEEIRKQSW